MAEHRSDALTVLAGAIFVGIALTVLLGGGPWLLGASGWLWPILLIGVGAAGLASARSARRRRRPGGWIEPTG